MSTPTKTTSRTLEITDQNGQRKCITCVYWSWEASDNTEYKNKNKNKQRKKPKNLHCRMILKQWKW